MGNRGKMIGTIISVLLFVIAILWFIEYQNRASYRAFSTQMVKEDCFGVDAQWTEDNELLNIPRFSIAAKIS